MFDTLQGNNGEEVENNLEQLEAPYVGMLFETLEQARNYYEDYGRQEGFWIRTRSSSKSRVCCNEVTSGQFTYAHQGKHVQRLISLILWKNTMKKMQVR